MTNWIVKRIMTTRFSVLVMESQENLLGQNICSPCIKQGDHISPCFILFLQSILLDIFIFRQMSVI